MSRPVPDPAALRSLAARSAALHADLGRLAADLGRVGVAPGVLGHAVLLLGQLGEALAERAAAGEGPGSTPSWSTWAAPRSRVQRSSLATEPAVRIFGTHGIGSRTPHLTVAQARMVRDALSEFIADAAAEEGGQR